MAAPDAESEVALLRVKSPASTPTQGQYTQTLCIHLVVARTISLAEDAYEALSAMRQPGESFSDVVRRLTRKRSLTELSGLLSRESADAIADAIDANRRERLKVRRRELGLE